MAPSEVCLLFQMRNKVINVSTRSSRTDIQVAKVPFRDVRNRSFPLIPVRYNTFRSIPLIPVRHNTFRFVLLQ